MLKKRKATFLSYSKSLEEYKTAFYVYIKYQNQLMLTLTRTVLVRYKTSTIG